MHLDGTSWQAAKIFSVNRSKREDLLKLWNKTRVLNQEFCMASMVYNRETIYGMASIEYNRESLRSDHTS